MPLIVNEYNVVLCLNAGKYNSNYLPEYLNLNLIINSVSSLNTELSKNCMRNSCYSQLYLNYRIFNSIKYRLMLMSTPNTWMHHHNILQPNHTLQAYAHKALDNLRHTKSYRALAVSSEIGNKNSRNGVLFKFIWSL